MAKRKSDGSPKKKSKSADKPAATDPSCATARYEAGHAVAAVRFGFEIYGVDIIPKPVPGSPGKYGLAGADLGLPDGRRFLGKGGESVRNILITLLAGVQAERKLNPDAGLEYGHPQSDGAVAFKYAAGAICTPVLEHGVLKTKGDEVERNKDQIAAFMDLMMDEAAEFAAEYEEAIDALADLIHARKQLTGDEVVRFLSAER